MYLRYYGFSEYPFSVTPDPAFLYLSASHREALGHLLYGTGEHGGFVALIGEVGTGKTTLIRALVDNDTPNVDIALCWNPHLGVEEFVATICDELGASYDPGTDTSLKNLVDRLNHHLLDTHANNRRTVLVIDEAQNLSRGVLEQLRLLTNLETHKHKLLRIILVGQPELEALLSRHDLRQLAQRITARFWLKPLTYPETRAYVQHRLKLAGGSQHIFTPLSLYWLRLKTGGIPRLINMVCERALMGGYAYAKSRISLVMVKRAAGETLPRRRQSRWLRVAAPAVVLLLAALVGALAWYPGIQLSRAAEWIQQDVASDSATGSDKNDPGARSAQANSGEAGNPDAGAASGGAGKSARADNQADNVDAEESVADTDTANTNDGKERGNRNRRGGRAGASDKAAGAVKEPRNAATEANGNVEGKADPKTDREAIKVAGAGDASGQTNPEKARDDKPDSAASANAIPAGDADLNQLLRLWGVFGSKVRSGCETLRVGELRCLADRGNFATVERFNRPALLTIHHDDKRQQVLLSSLDDNTATLVGADGTRRITRARLARLWTGQFEVIWRSDSGLGLIRPGAVGNAVVWLRKRLVRAGGNNPDADLGPPSPVYDDALEAQLKQFQLGHGLDPDGMAGPRTQMMLNGAVKMPGSPALRPVKK